MPGNGDGSGHCHGYGNAAVDTRSRNGMLTGTLSRRTALHRTAQQNRKQEIATILQKRAFIHN